MLWPFLLALTATLAPTVEVEEPIYTTPDAANGAGPMWCYGSSCIARASDEVFVSGSETLPDAKPLHNVRWVLWRRDAKGWQKVQADATGRQREPCPLGVFANGRLLLTSNPTLTPLDSYSGAAEPQVLVFDKADAAPAALRPKWEGQPAFTEHSYRGLAVDGPNREALLFNNVGYDQIHWSLLDRDGAFPACGRLEVPFGAEFEKPEPIRICYPVMALRGRAAHVLGISDIIEPVRAWREFKLALHGGKPWDYDFRRLYYRATPDVATKPWSPWLLVADRDATCGHITNLDLWLDKQGRAHLLWLETSVWDSRMRDKFFVGTPLTKSLMTAVIEDGQVTRRQRLHHGGEGCETGEQAGWARFHATPDGRLWVFAAIAGENRLVEVRPDGTAGAWVTVPMKHPMGQFMTATERLGSPASAVLDLYGGAQGVPGLSYARVRVE